MCGICGILPADGMATERVRAALRRMGHAQFHRGPDAWGEQVSQAVALGHNRLAIIDVAGGRQPMTSADGRFTVVFNGEIYNYRALWNELAALGHRFRTGHSDTEVIVNGFAQWGTGVFARLEGMFAVALWDARLRRLYVARDRFGIKPLYWAAGPYGAMFASEPKALLASGLARERALRPAALAEYFLFRAPVRGSMLAGIETLPPATFAELTQAGLVNRQSYWRAVDRTAPPSLDALEAAIADAARSHMIADVPVGVFLSGGVDSSYLAALVGAEHRIEGFAVGVPGPLDETPRAEAAAAHLGLPLLSRRVTAGDMLAELGRWSYFNDDPVADPSALALMLLAEHARGHGKKVMLAGEGADELFGGYNAYARFALVDRLMRTPVGRAAARLLPERARDLATADRCAMFLGTAQPASRALRRSLLKPAAKAGFDGLEAWLSAWWKGARRDFPGRPLRRALVMDQTFRLPSDLLMRTDRATMAWSLETRVPYLDRRVAELANALADRDTVRLLPLSTKPALKALAERRLPRELVRAKKRGFELPLADWLKDDLSSLLRDVLHERRIAEINYRTVAKLLAALERGAAEAAATLWAWLVLELWHRRWMQAIVVPPQPLVDSYDRDAWQLLAAPEPRAPAAKSA